MPDVYLGKQYGVITFARTFKAGDPRPTGYSDVYEWAEAHRKAGVKQRRCKRCQLWKFPVELSAVVEPGGPVCVSCATTPAATPKPVETS